ncbi:hypothetical protein LINGRAHAP2_LOCUS27925 [Linum grandiflorum]
MRLMATCFGMAALWVNSQLLHFGILFGRGRWRWIGIGWFGNCLACPSILLLFGLLFMGGW